MAKLIGFFKFMSCKLVIKPLDAFLVLAEGTIDEFGCDNWELLKKYHWLRPFAWIYQLVRWIQHGHRAGVSNPMKAIELIQKENRESAMLNKLQIHR